MKISFCDQFIDYTMYSSNGKFQLFWIEVTVKGYLQPSCPDRHGL